MLNVERRWTTHKYSRGFECARKTFRWFGANVVKPKTAAYGRTLDACTRTHLDLLTFSDNDDDDVLWVCVFACTRAHDKDELNKIKTGSQISHIY